MAVDSIHLKETMANKEIGLNCSPRKITEEQLLKFDDQSTARLAARLEEEDYSSPFESLNDWHLLRALAIHRPELTLNYHHLIDQEPFDED